MMRSTSVLVQGIVLFLKIHPIIFLLVLGMTQTASASTCIYDEFNGNSFDLVKWDVFKGHPAVSGGNLSLAAESGSRSEIQSKTVCPYGTLQATITSSNWKPQSEHIDDSSFGFEHFTGTNGQCHYAVHLNANGHLGILRAVPDAQGNCSGDPTIQRYIQISNWDAVRTGADGKINITIIWTSNSVTLRVNDGRSNSGEASYTGSTDIPAIPLKIRLNANCKARMVGDPECNSDIDEAYNLDYIRVGDSFALNIININPAGGTVISDVGGISCGATCNLPYVDGTSIKLSAIPAAGYQFSGWGRACSGYGNFCSMTMDADKSVTANFEVFHRKRSPWHRGVLPQ